jgi:phage baseplate assembly protein W
MAARYLGFWTGQFIENRPKVFSTSDMETVKRDLLNHIYTIKGERVMMPNFGTRIPLLAFEPLDETTLQIVKDDLREVIDADPRVELVDMVVAALPDHNAISAFVELKYLKLNITDTIRLDIRTGS